MELNHGNLAMLEQGFRGSFNVGLARSKPTWPGLAMEIPSVTAENIYAWLANNFTIREWIGDRHLQNLASDIYRIPNKDFEGTVKVAKNAISDDQYGIYSKSFEQMGDSVTLFPDKQVYQLVTGGFAQKCWDGQYFFDTDHPVGLPGREASVSNHMGGSGSPWFILDTSKVLKPFIWQPREAFKMVRMDGESTENVFMRKDLVYGVDGRSGTGYGLWQLAVASKQTLNSTNVRAALTAMGQFKGNNGEPLDVQGDTIVVGAGDRETAIDLFSKEMLTGGETNTLRGRLKVVASGWIS